MDGQAAILHNDCMIESQSIKVQDLAGLSPIELSALVPQLLWHIDEQSRYIGEQTKHIVDQRRQLDSAAQAIKWRDAKIERITFELAAEGVAVRREVRAHERRAADAVRRDAGRR